MDSLNHKLVESIANNGGNKEYIIEEIIVNEILCRLRVKSLVRFKCVCKRWKFLIEQDKYLIDLHHTQSKTPPCLLITPYVGHMEPFMAAELVFQGRDRAISAAAVHTIDKTCGRFVGGFITRIVGPVNGVMGFFQGGFEPPIRIWNISTQEEIQTPIIKSRLFSKLEDEDSGIHWTMKNLVKSEMGFSPATNEHKVICISSKSNADHIPGSDVVYEVLTVGDNKWRKIDKVPPYKVKKDGASVYLNGIIYFITENDSDRAFSKFIVTFNVDTEEFGSIIISEPVISLGHFIGLFEVDGRLALLFNMSYDIVKLWIYDDEENTSTSNHNWIEDTIELPNHICRARITGLHFHSAVGTDQIMLSFYGGNNLVSLYSYHVKNKTFTEIETTGFPSCPGWTSIFRFKTFVESLLPLKMQSTS